jgi:hypothetical protein
MNIGDERMKDEKYQEEQIISILKEKEIGTMGLELRRR